MANDAPRRKRIAGVIMAMTLAGTGLTVVDAMVTPAVAAPCLRIGQGRLIDDAPGQGNDDQQGQDQGQDQGQENGEQEQGNDDARGRNRGDDGRGRGLGGDEQSRDRGSDALGQVRDRGNGGDEQGRGRDQENGEQGQGPDRSGGDEQGQGQESVGGQDGDQNPGGLQGVGDLGGEQGFGDAAGEQGFGDAAGEQGEQQALGEGNGQDGEQLQAFGRRNPDGNDRGSGGNGGNSDGGGGNAGGGGGQEACEDVGPELSDFADVRTFPRANQPRFGPNGSRGTFVSRCGTNQNGHFNSDNHIVAPGVSNGAQHQHDYVGNLTTSGQSTNESLAAGGTTCARDDRSAYFWPVLRDRTRQGDDAGAPGGGQDGNIGRILTPRSAIMEFRGNPQSKVVAAPRFLRMITGDAKSAVNGGANARAGWTCSGFQDRISGDKYPLCPRGSLVTRVLDFPSCWDGQNLDSANHRTHVVFPGDDGACPSGTQAIPQLRMTLTYATPPGASFAVDAFPDQRHAPITDHADFHNVMPENLMNLVVDCINSGRRC